MDAWIWLGFTTGVGTAGEVERKAEGGSVPVDLRSPEEFRAGHIPGAVNVPAKELLADPAALNARVRESVPEALAVTLYMAGAKGGGAEPELYRAAYSIEDHQAAFALEGKVRLAVFLYPAGFSGWKADGRPVHSTE